MSRRYLKKIQNQTNKIISNSTESPENCGTSVASDDDDNDEPTVNNQQLNNNKSFNVFNVFSEDNSDDNHDQNSNNDSDQSHEEELQPEMNQLYISEDSLKNKQKNKKKRRKKKSVKSTNNRNVNDDDDEFLEMNSPTCSTDNQGNEDNQVVLTACPVNFTTQSHILQVQQEYLNPDNELKRLCGGRLLDDEMRSAFGVDRRRKVRYFRKIVLTGSCKWLGSEPHTTIKSMGLSMLLDDSINDQIARNSTTKNNNIQYFVYVHSNSYKEIQKIFYEAVESKQPGEIVSILSENPFHVDSLLQFSEICKLHEDLQKSAEYVERSLHCLEVAFHPSFNVTSGNCRLSYKKQTNRALFIALFRHLLFVSGRACYRTSLELCKLLLSFDPDNDPLACVLIIDWLSIRAKEYQWFINISQFFNVEKNRNLAQLPNIAYGLALAYYYLPDQQEKADSLLQDALFMFPNVLTGVLDKCGVEPDKRLSNHSYFFNNNIATSKSLKKLEDLYVIRSHPLWRNTEILAWLKDNVHAVMDKIDSGEAKEHIKFCKAKRKTRYQGQLPRNISRHIILSDIKEITLSYPEIGTEETIFSYDPLPPVDSIDTYDLNTRLGRTRNQTDQSTSTASIGNVLSLFISSLFPSLSEDEQIRHLADMVEHQRDDRREEFD